MGVYPYDRSLERESCKMVLKLEFTEHGIIEPLSEFGPKPTFVNCFLGVVNFVQIPEFLAGETSTESEKY
jgi:hypothetical protein